MTESTDPEATDEATRRVDEDDAKAAHKADRMPTPEEEQIADGLEVDPDVGRGLRRCDRARRQGRRARARSSLTVSWRWRGSTRSPAGSARSGS